jgi:hypothetical protein
MVTPAAHLVVRVLGKVLRPNWLAEQAQRLRAATCIKLLALHCGIDNDANLLAIAQH